MFQNYGRLSKQANVLLNLLAKAPSVGRRVGSFVGREAVIPAASGAAAYYASPYISDYIGIESDLGKKLQQATMSAQAVALASPTIRRRLFTKQAPLSELLKGKAGVAFVRRSKLSPKELAALQRKSRNPFVNYLLAQSMITLSPTLGKLTDSSKMFAENLKTYMEKDPNQIVGRTMTGDAKGVVHDFAVEPFVAALKELQPELTKTTNQVLASQAASLAPPFLLGLGSLALGTGSGYLAGRGLSNALLPDSEELPYKKRRRREKARAAVSNWLMPTLGGALGMGLSARYLLPAYTDAVSGGTFSPENNLSTQLDAKLRHLSKQFGEAFRRHSATAG